MSHSDRSPDRRRALHPAWEAALVVAVGLAVAAAAFWSIRFLAGRGPATGRRGASRSAYAAYAGSQSCRECHPGETAAHARSGHAHTLRRAASLPLARRLDGLKVSDPERRDVSWGYEFRDGQLSVERHDAGQVERLVIDYAFGSGHHATTFATLTDRTPEHPVMIEHRMTVFAHKSLPDITPGQAREGKPQGQGPFGRRYEGGDALKCFECHTTRTSSRGPDILDERTMIPNIGCERCHGPGRAHVEAARRGADDAALAMPFGPGRWSSAELMRLCGACHRLPEMGDPSLIRPSNPVMVRFQPIGLMQSACYRKSAGAMSCVTCHDPHARTSTDRNGYEAACLACHQSPSQTPCKVSPASGCVGCHMPRRDVSRGMMLTDHWIR